MGCANLCSHFPQPSFLTKAGLGHFNFFSQGPEAQQGPEEEYMG